MEESWKSAECTSLPDFEIEWDYIQKWQLIFFIIVEKHTTQKLDEKWLKIRNWKSPIWSKTSIFEKVAV